MALSAHQKSQNQLSPLPFSTTAAPPPSPPTLKEKEKTEPGRLATLQKPHVNGWIHHSFRPFMYSIKQ